MKKLRWQLVIVLLALIAIGVLLAGQQPRSLLPSEPQQVKPVTGGIYAEGLVGSIGRLNPLLDTYNAADRDVDRLIFSGLLRFDARGLPQHDLVESMGISKNGKKYNFSLRKDAVWQDGKPITSQDVIFTIDLMRSEALPVPEDIRALWNAVEVEAIDEHTVQFRLPEPYAPFEDYLTFGILPEHLLGELPDEAIKDAPFNLAPVGSGPYRFDHLLVEDGKVTGVVLKRFDRFYGGAPFIEQVIFRYYPDSQAALSAYRSEEVQGISQVSPQDVPEVLAEPDLSLYTAQLPQLSLVYLNLKNPAVPFFQDGSVRKALMLGLNRQLMIDKLLDGQAVPAEGPIFPGSWAYYPGLEPFDHDPETAVSLLKAAGYTIPASGGNVRAKEDQTFSFELLYPDDAEHAALAEEIAKDWQEIGVQAQPKAVSYESLVNDHLQPHDFQAALVDFNLARFPDPDPYPFWHQEQITGGQNYAQWDDRQASEYLEQARITLDFSERARLYRNFQVRFDSELPALPLFYPVYSYAVDSRVQGVSLGSLFDPSDRFLSVTSWYLVAQRAVASNSEPAATGTSAP